MSSGYLWVKAFHIVFVAARFAALFYLPRLMVTVGHHQGCARLLSTFADGRNRCSERWFRVFNEMSVLLFAAVVVLVVVKPF